MPAMSVRRTWCERPRTDVWATMRRSSWRPESALSRSMPIMGVCKIRQFCARIQRSKAFIYLRISNTVVGRPRHWPSQIAPKENRMPVIIGALRENAPNETRVSLIPEVADKFAQTGARMLMEQGAGVRANFPDALYKKVEWAPSGSDVL